MVGEGDGEAAHHCVMLGGDLWEQTYRQVNMGADAGGV